MIFIFILNYVLIVTFWIFIYHEIWILLNVFLYETIELFILWHVWRYSGVLWVNSCPPLTRPHQRQSCMSGQALLHHWLCNQKHPWGIRSCSPIVNFLKVTFYHEMVSLVIFLIKKIIYIDTLNMKICWVFMKIWIIFKSCCSLWHVENFRKYSNHILKDIFMCFSVPILWKYC